MPFVKGQIANPAGRSSRARNRLTDRFIKELDRDFRDNGAAAIVKCREEHPEQYIAVVARLLPKDTQVTVTHELSSRFIAAVRQANTALPTTSGAGEVIDVTPEPTDEAKPLIAHDTQRSKD